MPDFGIGEAIAAITAFGAEAAAGAGEAAVGLGSVLGEAGGGLLGGIEGGLGALGEGLGGALGDIGGGLSGLFGGAESGLGGPLGELGLTGAEGLPQVGGALESNLMAFTPDIASQDWINGLTGVFEPGTAAAGGGVEGMTELAGLTGGTGGQGMTELAGLGGAGGTDLLGAGGGAAGGGTDVLAGGASKGGGIFDMLGGSVMKNPLGIAAAGAGLGYNILQGNKLTANEQALTNAANTQAGQGAMLQQYIQTGQLPPGLQAMVDNATKAAKAQMISSYAAKGLNADPNGNTQLAQDLAAIDMKAAEAGGQMAINLLQQGINETGMSNGLYQFLIGQDNKQTELMGKAISNFSTALAGGPKIIGIGTGAVA